MTDITIPNVGESVSEVTIAQWFKAVGDTVKKDEPLVELETDKAAQELVSPADGVLEEILVAEGENAEIGKLIARLGSGSGAKAADKGDAEVKAQTEAPSSDKSTGAGAGLDIVVPNVGESVSEVTVASWMVGVGDAVEKDQPIVELETDKAAQELVAPRSGVITVIVKAEGDIALVGDVLARLGESDSDPISSSPAKSAGGEGGAGGKLPDVPPTNTGSLPNEGVAMPAAAKIIRESGLDASAISGTGKGGRITKADALAAKANPPKAPAGAKPVPAAPKAPRNDGPREDRVRMTRIRQTIARRLKDAQNTAAMLTTYNEADMTAIMDMRSQYKELFIKRHGVKLGFMSFFVKACVQALKDVPSVNAEIDGTDIIYKNFYDISIAVGTEKGLVVPVLRDCDELSLGGIEKGIGALGAKARDGQLSMDDMSGGTFTISNGGVYGSLMSSPILNPPQSGILGMHKIQKRPVVINDEMVIRPMMYLALSYDHRIVDGKEAVTFLVRVKECLEDPERMLLDL
ncbi:dihydrolipoyllysine-residue succinyltransferase component of 2-oxoglutarate dehydrogenase complex [Litorimonas cladophorae]|uniref:Dihydrolipoyllysine-residue succinyltransferase component of 2-oxoglutarate dehydrogenase complex n=1 Tax=Litorimonas cladophorae TaxID=1220491 RepID=A0A918KHP3_9PROT|nr:2-oxoglutarate dehydrogenase complex dihydrolipoyllysine-residue succinyltransferase [Litorimonas cladophorae]GGX64186.1 dihydrolipoyllysine-residue succinyltransferase component of 2-oxoglutarate dehydrogenase complex [Litorimonas cladophorae]